MSIKGGGPRKKPRNALIIFWRFRLVRVGFRIVRACNLTATHWGRDLGESELGCFVGGNYWSLHRFRDRLCAPAKFRATVIVGGHGMALNSVGSRPTGRGARSGGFPAGSGGLWRGVRDARATRAEAGSKGYDCRGDARDERRYWP